MTEDIHAAEDPIEVDPRRTGISYSGGGPLLLVELGCAKAFIECGIVPDVIAGVSAGSFAGVAHALDPKGGKGIKLAMDLLGTVSKRTIQAGYDQIAERVIGSWFHPMSLADQIGVGALMRDAIQREMGLTNVTVGTFKTPPYVKLVIAATDILTGESVWMPDDIAIEDAVIASSSIPGFFPPRRLLINGTPCLVVDGGVVTNQPLTRLAQDEHCGTIYACAVGYAGGVTNPPKNALQNALSAVSMSIHQTMKLEQALVEAKAGITIQRIHPPMQVSSYDFTPEYVAAVVEQSRGLTHDWLANTLKVCKS